MNETNEHHYRQKDGILDMVGDPQEKMSVN